MDNTIIIKRGVPSYLLTYWMGVLTGLGIDYSLNRGSQLYVALNERRRERNRKMEIGDTNLTVERITKDDVRILSAGNPNDTKVSVKVLYA